VHDKAAAMEKLFKHLGLYERDNEQKTDPLKALLMRVASNSNNGFDCRGSERPAQRQRLRRCQSIPIRPRRMTRTIEHGRPGAHHPLNQIPSNPEELERCLADPEWRIFSGCLYKIMIKGDGDDDAYSVPFKPNRAQKRFLKRLWHRNIILKARQLGFTT
jgi:hypothetical protein